MPDENQAKIQRTRRYALVLIAIGGLLLGSCSTAEKTTAGSVDQTAASTCKVPVKDRNKLCTQQYEPVCGCDGRTYGNACVASANGVMKVAEGRCEDNHEQL